MLNNQFQCWLLPLGGVKDEGDDAQDLRRTESDSILKKVSLDLSVCYHSEFKRVTIQDLKNA